MIRVADYIAQAIADAGVTHVFTVTGGGAMFLNDALGHHPGLTAVYCHHEQAAAMAAECHARVSGGIGAVCVTTGPGGINALNGVFGAWTDSVPMIAVSGQVRRETIRDRGNLRQLGDQEVDIIGMVRPITKYAVSVRDPQTIRYHMERAIHLCRNERPGPCWIDVPVDVQATMVDPEKMGVARPQPCKYPLASSQVADLLARLRAAERPVILAGGGVRAAGAVEEFRRVTTALDIPVATAWAPDVIVHDHPCFVGRQGVIGDRGGNFAVQNADLLLIVGSRLSIRHTSYNWQTFSPKSYKVWVDVDPAEFTKPTVKPDMPILCDAKVFLKEMSRQLGESVYAPHHDWLKSCKDRQEAHRKVSGNGIDAYQFVEALWKQLANDDVVVCGDGTACIAPLQSAKVRAGQRLIANSGCASMGYDLPAAVGAAFARPGKRVICITGDGSIQLNIQELQTIVHHRLPIKVFVLNNDGYATIRGTQKRFFGRTTGEGPSSGLSFPDMVKVAEAYGIPSLVGVSKIMLPSVIRDAFMESGPVLVDLIMDPDQVFEPRLESKQQPDGSIVTASLEDMT